MQAHLDAVSDDREQRLLIVARSDEAQLFALRTKLNENEISRLRALLDTLIEMGALALYRFDTPVADTTNSVEVERHLRTIVGEICGEAAIGASHYPASVTPKPQTLIPVWPFERLNTNSDILTAYGVFLRMPIAFEALPVADIDPTECTPDIGSLFPAWRQALGQDAILGTVSPPGHDGAHAVLASVRAG